MKRARRVMRMAPGIVILLALNAACASAQRQPAMLHVAAAADLQPVMPALAAAYEKKTGVHVEASFGSSGTLAAQIENGAPFDIFLGADFTFPEKVIAAHLATERMPVPYARGTLVLFARKDSPVQPLSVGLLTDSRITRIAVADQFHAPFGRAAYEALLHMKIDAQVKPKLVVAENVTQTAQFVESGNAQLGLISLTLASSPHLRAVGSYVLMPMVYLRLEQCAVVLSKSPNVAAAQAFLDWLRSAEVQPHLKDFGLEPVR